MDQAMFRLAQQGLSRLSPAAVAELGSLVQVAHHAGMVKVERELEALATQVERSLARDPLADDRKTLAGVNRIWWLTREARQAWLTGRDPSELVGVLGEARRQYVPVEAPVPVQALGAHGWVTDSDFVGVTVVFRSGERVLQVSNARPCAYFGREPLRLLRMPVSETLGLTIQELSHGAFLFDRARISADGRMSMHADLRVHDAPWQGSSAYSGRTANTWDGLVELLRGRALQPVHADLATLALIEPLGWGAVEVDEARGEARMPLTDGRGAVLTARVALRPENNLWVDNLERLAKHERLRPPALFGRATATGGLSFEPWTAVYGVPVRLGGRPELRVNEVHLGLEDLDRVTRGTDR